MSHDDKDGKGAATNRDIRRRGGCLSVTWVLLAVVVSVSLAVGACALWLPDRAPGLLGAAGEVTSVPVGVQEYAGSQQVTLVPTVSSARDLVGNVSGTVTADWSAGGLESGKAAYRVNDRVVVALGTATPLYRDLVVGDRGDDVLALNNELNRLGYGGVPGSDEYLWDTSEGVRRLMNDRGDTSDGGLRIADVLWIPAVSVRVGSWDAVVGVGVTAGMAVGQVPGMLTRLTVKNGRAADMDRTVSVLGQTGTLPAGSVEITDAAFLDRVAASDDYRLMDEATLAAGLGASLALAEPVTVLRVPAGAVFGVDGTQGCVAVPRDGSPDDAGAFDVVRVSIVGSELGASLVRTGDGGPDVSSIARVAIGSRIAAESCR
ncbi:hypothetical protein [Bifidobacterium sp. SO1]|uniref:hypothetical protein n=1 Tax=Bifidobacterium sp. SO1 TaxID=2809029 RepID=UPI001BDCA958|nr:hypothetical protein [Bifidobacterium sp. SO1]MBT1162636.1 hypothetical protein [Bifidobacterium sp. SO1]